MFNAVIQMYFFLQEKTCTHLRIEVDSKAGTIINQEHLDTATKLGIEKIDATDATKYVVTILRNFLLQRDKLEAKLLGNYLNREIVKHWQTVLSSLEDLNRKLINIESGSLIFMLYCPTQKSKLQTQDQNWRIEIQNKMDDFSKTLGKFCVAEMKKNYFTNALFYFGRLLIETFRILLSCTNLGEKYLGSSKSKFLVLLGPKSYNVGWD